MTGPRLAAIVGPSGVGKDSLIAALAAADPRLRPIRRVITRPADGTEPFVSATEEDFDAMLAQGAFRLHWSAHGLRYGVPMSELAKLHPGQTGLVNLSRGILDVAARCSQTLIVLSVTAPADVLAQRLAGRGRETEREIADRLARPRPAPPQGVTVVEIDNGGSLDQAVGAALSVLSEAAA
ncbi:MAG: phosphonate metabolism protein/1,5-bisphosphokinase (PRPP-forming) PhnN [Pseudomonadota bacterium]